MSDVQTVHNVMGNPNNYYRFSIAGSVSEFNVTLDSLSSWAKM
jgi:hypothetical protein